MPLPVIKPRSEEIELSDGQKLEVRGLSRQEALNISDLGDDVQAVEIRLVAYATDSEVHEADVWYATAPSADVQTMVAAVMRLSGLDEATPKGSSED